MRFCRLLSALGFFVSTISPLSAELPAEELAKSSSRIETTRMQPKAYGTEDFSITVIPAVAFFPATFNEQYFTSGSLGRYGPPNTRMSFYAPVQLPDNVEILYVGLNSLTDAPNAIGVLLHVRLGNGGLFSVADVQSTVHGWGTDYNVATSNYVWRNNSGQGLMLEVEQGVFPTLQYFGSVEIWWKRVVTFQGGVPTFLDVPSDHPFYPFVEALSDSGITAGCGGGNFCPNEPVTRGQMAVFLAKALGLHSPGATDPP